MSTAPAADVDPVGSTVGENRSGMRGESRSTTWERASDLAAIVAAIVPVVVAAVRAAAGTWIPIGDDAYFTARSLDVATADHPLLGAWSSGSVAVETPVNNLGPMQLDLLAPFTRVAPMGGTAVGVACVHIAAIVTIAWLIRRIGGRRYILPAMAAVSVLGWSMGSEMLITPQQHQFLVFPLLCVLVAAWAVTGGDRWALVPVVVFGSLAAQTHLSHPVLLAALALPMVAGQVMSLRRDAASGKRASMTPYAVSAVVAAILWMQTAIDQFFVSGNFGDVLTAGGESPTPTLGTAVRIAADVVAAPLNHLRPGYREFNPAESTGSDLAVASLIAVVIVLVAGFVVALRKRRRVAAAGLAVAIVVLAAGVVNASMLPVSAELGLLATNYRWLWAIVTYLLLGAFCLIVRIAPRLSASHGSTIAATAFAVVLGVTTVANIPRSIQVFDPAVYAHNQEATREMLTQLGTVPIDSPVIIDQDGMYLGHPYTYPILTMLTDRDIDYRFEPPIQARRFGDRRVSDGSEPQRLQLVFGEAAEQRRFETTTVAYVDADPPVAVSLIDEADSL